MSLIVEQLSIAFGGLRALDDVTFRVPTGSIVGLIGPNGAGKSTLVNCLTGSLLATSGGAAWNGLELVGRSPEAVVRAGVVRTFQHARLIPNESVLGNVMVGAHATGRSGFLAAALRLPSARADDGALRARAMEAIDSVGCAHLADRRAAELTAGQQRLIALARALAAQPALLLLDEPAAGLNDAETAKLEDNLRLLHLERGLTIVVIEHHLPFVMSISDALVVVSQGRVIAEGPPAIVAAAPEVISAYTGASVAQG